MSIFPSQKPGSIVSCKGVIVYGKTTISCDFLFKKPERVIYFSIMLIILCSIIYLISPYNMITPVDKEKSFLDCFYFSTVTYTTLGYGDMSPIGWLRIISSIEAFFGALSLGFIVAGFSNTKY